MSHNALSGGRPSAFLRVGYGVAALGGVLTVIFFFVDHSGGWFGKFTWNDTTLAIITGLLTVVSLAQAVAPSRFFWPGWVIAAIAVFGVGAGIVPAISFVSLKSEYGYAGSLWTHLLLFYYVGPVIFMVGIFLALLAWQLQPTKASGPASYYFLMNDKISEQMNLDAARARVASGTISANAGVSVDGSPWAPLGTRRELF